MSLEDISSDGRFAVLAIDHRDSLRAFLAPDDPGLLAGVEITALKREMVMALADLATGVMLEPEYSIPQLLEARALPDGVGFLAALESQGYLADPGAAPTTILEGWSVEAAAASGAAAAKLLLPYHPQRPLAAEQEEVAATVLAECQRVSIPLVLEPLFYDLASPDERPHVVLETTRRFASLGPDLLKLPFPAAAPTGGEPDLALWSDLCDEISSLCSMPWALLSGGGSYEAFEQQLAVALSSGCAGFMVGRALWGEAALAPAGDRAAVMRDLVRPRLERLRAMTLVRH